MKWNSEATTAETIDEVLQHIDTANLANLLPTVAHLTGDLSVLRPEWKPSLAMYDCVCRLSPEQDKEARDLCRDRLTAFFASGRTSAPAPTYDQVSAIGRWYAGEAFDPILPYIAEECATVDSDPRRPRWHKKIIAPERPFHVAIIGAGVSGITLAYRLKQAGIPFTIYEKNADVGGTWWENTYPGCRCDLSSFTYSFSFKRKVWSEVFSTQADILTYIKETVQECGLYEHIRFNAEVTQATWNEKRSGWNLEIQAGAGSEPAFSNAIVFGTGQLNRPNMPNIPGIESFEGPWFHSARWEHDVDLTGKRVAVIGSGASSVQFTPQVAKRASHISLSARSTAWFVPTPDLHDTVTADEKFLLENLSHFAMWKRAGLITSVGLGILDACIVDPDYPPTERAISAKSEELRQILLAWQEANIVDRPDLRDVVISNAPVAAKRVIRDNGTWTKTLKRDNVTVVKDSIAEITPKGIKCADGTEHEFDVIIYGTGFRASDLLFPVKIIGRDGIELDQFWDGNPNAYIGATIPNFPNMFCLYGPKTGLAAHGGTTIQFSELASKYTIDAFRYMFEAGVAVLDVRPEVFEAYTERVESHNLMRVWGWSSASGWYKNKQGKGMIYPFPAAEYWHRTDHIIASDYKAY